MLQKYEKYSKYYTFSNNNNICCCISIEEHVYNIIFIFLLTILISKIPMVPYNIILCRCIVSIFNKIFPFLSFFDKFSI